MFVYDTQDFKNFRNNLFLNNSTSFSPMNQKNTIFFPTDNLKEENKIKNMNLTGVYKSASITFYSKTLGYLLCQEVRDNKLVYHPIGGKYEERDESIEYTAIREFIEETGILKHVDFVNLLNHFQYTNYKNNSLEKRAIDYIYNILINNNITHHYDYYVNINKEYIHKYYLINVDKLNNDFMNIIRNMDSFYETTFKEFKNNDEYIVSLYWDKSVRRRNLNKKIYSMLTIYLSNLIKKEE